MRLEWHEPYLKTFTARVESRRVAADGTWLTLDRSAFYPTSGGQLHDTGVLAELPVLDVQLDDERVWHRVEPTATVPAPQVGSLVKGSIDWGRRFTHMQRHTGQHLLSQAFVRVGRERGAEYATRSVSLRGADCTLDVTGDPDDAVLTAVEAEAERAARSALPVSAFEVDEADLHRYTLRRPAKVSGTVRLVSIAGYDLVACGGTHVASTAELLPLKLLGAERVKGDLTRVTFRVGAEAVADYVEKNMVTTRLGASLSVPPGELPERVAVLQQQLADLRQELAAVRGAAASSLAGDLLAAADRDSLPDLKVVSHVLAPEESASFEALIDELQRADDSVSLLASVGADGRVRLAFLAGPGADVDVRPALQAALEVVGGRGGGRPDRAQGAGEHGDRAAAALEAGRRSLLAKLPPV